MLIPAPLLKRLSKHSRDVSLKWFMRLFFFFDGMRYILYFLHLVLKTNIHMLQN